MSFRHDDVRTLQHDEPGVLGSFEQRWCCMIAVYIPDLGDAFWQEVRDVRLKDLSLIQSLQGTHRTVLETWK